jgi:F0F1-type ATP synthase membrane subunit c/vacuolar-type H+-ATPase subunit K
MFILINYKLCTCVCSSLCLIILKILVFMLFVKAAKSLAFSITFLPLAGCAVAGGLIFASLLRSIAYSPDYEEVLFNYAIIGFAFVESFAFMLFGVADLVYGF